MVLTMTTKNSGNHHHDEEDDWCTVDDDEQVATTMTSTTTMTAVDDDYNKVDMNHDEMKTTSTKQNTSTKKKTSTTMIEKYSKEYFEKLIEDMKSKLVEQIPTIESKVLNTFTSSCQSYQDAKLSLVQAKSVLDGLEKEKEKKDKNNDSDDDDKKDLDDLIAKAKDAVASSQTTLNDTVIVCTNTARLILLQEDGGIVPLDDVDEILLIQCTVLIQATPSKLSDWCKTNVQRNGTLFEKYFYNHPEILKQMISNGTPSYGNYGQAFDIYDTIINNNSNTTSSLTTSSSSSSHRSSPPRPRSLTKQTTNSNNCIICTRKKLLLENEQQRNGGNKNDFKSCNCMKCKLTMAVALQLCQPRLHFHSKTDYIDPIQRYNHYLQAYQNKELDDVFDTLSIFELRYVIDNDATNEEIQWGRNYLKAYRPDEILMDDVQWKYCWAVRSDVGYRHPDHDFTTYAGLLSAGGECGPRAWFGRFMCKCFGIPTWGVRQPGHAAMSHYTNGKNGWMICLGAAWEYSWWEDERYGAKSNTRHGPDFYEETQARKACCVVSITSSDVYYKTVCKLECIAEIVGETLEEDVTPNKVWRSLALMQRKIHAESIQQVVEEEEEQQQQVQQASSYDLPPWSQQDKKKGFNLISDDSSSDSSSISSLNLPRLAISSTACGSIVIPATSFSSPTKPSKNVLSMPSFLGGGTQLHLENDGSVEYILPDFVTKGSYMLTCRLVTVHMNQVPLLLTIELNDGDDVVDDDDMSATVDLYSIDVEYTVGAWRTTSPIKIELGPKATLKFSREQPCHGVSIKDFTCQPC